MRTNLKKIILIFSILIPIFFQKQLLSDDKSIKHDLKKDTIKWKKLNTEKQSNNKVTWQKIKNKKDNLFTNNEVND